MSYARENIADMSGYIPGEQPPAGKFIKLNTNENPYPPSSQVLQAISQVSGDCLRRYPDPSASAFRRVAGDLFGFPEDWILCGNGSDDILTIAMRTFVGEGQAVRFPTPSYVLYKTLAQIQDARPQAVPFTSDWTLDKTFSERDDNVRLAIIANPNSPSGTCLTPDQIRVIANQLPCPLLVDEAYVDFADTDCLSLVREYEHVMVSRTLSKSYALAGIRFGFVLAQPSLIEQIQKVKDSYNCDAIATTAATAAISDQRWLDETRRQIVATRTRASLELASLGFQIPPSQANFLWCPHPGKNLKPVYQELKNRHILVRYMDYSGWPEGLRITVGTDEQMDACLGQLADILG
ncbi:MAG: histidinol-phosphate transaminase [Planctomycetales bacterium]|nr:histidinol-phosphate transaminase [Planctomycetales bacterium]